MQSVPDKDSSSSKISSGFLKDPQPVEIVCFSRFSPEKEDVRVRVGNCRCDGEKESGGCPQPNDSTGSQESTHAQELAFIQTVIDTKIGKDSARVPVIIRGLDIGACRTKWTEDYLKSVGPTKLVKVHRSYTPQLDFRNKNFSYQTIPFAKLVEYCSQFHTSEESINKEEIAATSVKRQQEKNPRESDDTKALYYLRSLGDDPRGKDISDLSIHFPELYQDLRIPPLFPQSSFFSSVFRITSPTLQLWTHYDTCDNILIQIRGRKRIVFFPPWEALNLVLDGDKSEVIDIDNPTAELYPDFLKIERLEGFLEEGDIVFIPALWFHNITALSFSISVNVFWQNLEKDKYDKKDTYGNHDVIPAQLGFRTLDKAVAQLKVLPIQYQDFYLRRMIMSLQKRLSSIQPSDTNDSEEE